MIIQINKKTNKTEVKKEKKSGFKNILDIVKYSARIANDKNAGYIKIIYKRRNLIMLITLVSMLFTGIFSLLKSPVYEASATFFPMNVREYYGSQSEAHTLKRQLDIEDLIISVLESRKMADRIIDQLGLKNVFKVKLTEDARDELEKRTRISLGRNGIIKLSVRAESADFASRIASDTSSGSTPGLSIFFL